MSPSPFIAYFPPIPNASAELLSAANATRATLVVLMQVFNPESDVSFDEATKVLDEYEDPLIVNDSLSGEGETAEAHDKFNTNVHEFRRKMFDVGNTVHKNLLRTINTTNATCKLCLAEIDELKTTLAQSHPVNTETGLITAQRERDLITAMDNTIDNVVNIIKDALKKVDEDSLAIDASTGELPGGSGTNPDSSPKEGDSEDSGEKDTEGKDGKGSDSENDSDQGGESGGDEDQPGDNGQTGNERENGEDGPGNSPNPGGAPDNEGGETPASPGVVPGSPAPGTQPAANTTPTPTSLKNATPFNPVTTPGASGNPSISNPVSNGAAGVNSGAGGGPAQLASHGGSGGGGGDDSRVSTTYSGKPTVNDGISPDTSMYAKSKDGEAVRPTPGQITSVFGSRWGSFHYGVDFGDPIGQPIASMMAGTVIEAGPASGFGLWIRVQHDDGATAVYGHVNELKAAQGQQVNAGDVIATVGNRGNSTGSHLHLEIWDSGQNKIDPLPYMASKGIPEHSDAAVDA